MLALVGLFQMRNGEARAIELAGQVNGDAAIPVFRIDLFDAAGRSGDAGIVDKAVEAAEIGECGFEQRVDLRAVGDVAARGLDAGQRRRERGQRRIVDVTDMNARAFAHERPCDFKPDATSAGSDEDACASQSKVHRSVSVAGCPPHLTS